MTRISSIATYSISVPRPEPVWTAHEELKAWSVILVAIKTDDGLTGYGEIHGAPIPRICDWVARFAEIAHGMDALAHEAVWARRHRRRCRAGRRGARRHRRAAGADARHERTLRSAGVHRVRASG